MSIADLHAGLEAAAPSIDHITGALLRYLRAHAGDVRRLYADDHAFAALAATRRELARGLRARRVRDELDAGERAELLSLLADAIALRMAAFGQAIAAAMVARAAAEAIDHLRGHRFALLFRERGDVELAPGDPLPVPRPPLRRLLGGSLATDPDRRGDAIDRTRHLQLVPPLTRGHRVVYATRYADHLAALPCGARLAVAIPGDPSELDWHTRAEPRPVFFDVAPRDPEARTRAVIDLVRSAADAGAEVVVLPELCVDGDGQDALGRAFDTMPAALRVLVAGSAHRVVDGERRNLAVTHVRGAPAAQHAKFNRFRLPIDGVDHDEDIATEPATLTIFAAGGAGDPARGDRAYPWTFAVLVCKDLLEPEVDHLLGALRVSLVLVPSCSPTTEPFRVAAHALVGDAQSIVLVANAADPNAHRDPAVAVYAAPRALDPVRVWRRADHPPPVVVFADDPE